MEVVEILANKIRNENTINVLDKDIELKLYFPLIPHMALTRHVWHKERPSDTCCKNASDSLQQMSWFLDPHIVSIAILLY